MSVCVCDVMFMIWLLVVLSDPMNVLYIIAIVTKYIMIAVVSVYC